MTMTADTPATMIAATVTCTTTGCDNEGIPITIEIPDTAPHVICGPCGQPIALESEEA